MLYKLTGRLDDKAAGKGHIRREIFAVKPFILYSFVFVPLYMM